MSMQRYCGLYRAHTGEWFMNLASQEYGACSDAITYGPFASEANAVKYLDDNFSNPGGYSVDQSMNRPVPRASVNGSPVVRPVDRRW